MSAVDKDDQEARRDPRPDVKPAKPDHAKPVYYLRCFNLKCKNSAFGVEADVDCKPVPCTRCGGPLVYSHRRERARKAAA